jgi:hypothetical protein
MPPEKMDIPHLSLSWVAIGGVTNVDTSSGSEGGSNHSCCLCICYRIFCTVVMFVTVEVINF